MLTAVALGAAVGAVDGFAAERDRDAGRSWQSPGIATSGAPVIGWGWAPAVQVASTGIGAAAAAMGYEWGIGPLLAGAGLLTRAAVFTLAQHGSSTPAATQGLRAGGGRRR